LDPPDLLRTVCELWNMVEADEDKDMKTLTTALFAGVLMIASPLALADDLVIAPELSVKFHDDVKVKKYKSHKWDGDLAVGVVVPGEVEYYEVPSEVVVVTPALEDHRYAYINDHVYIVDSDRRIVAIVE
jgi:hypothetical protein